MAHPKAKWILATLKVTPLDRIRIMKTLFLMWKREGNISDYFRFEPYLYGPCSFEVYDILAAMEREGLIVQPSHSVAQWAKYYLTQRGREEAERAIREITPELRERLEAITTEVSRFSFYELLKRVYTEAPEFATNSVLREVVKQ
ncbi:hypothetical protein A946_11250 [Methylacidiphilum kamchatkense Kam1]|uniref:Antitoxin SocA-like Panacea domain-containing protein n=1 Tax=Methylacidiphilum kamchatkense Kam1 TaxID=1202785 RepID=A0A0C1UML8_9BACT|nr:hypothetical protein [Methylacidiphilum kamchatkense]KIE57799.1 hypothetical protein A946_11250 [Methylacidiphilum kamchatkense Kam1]QDQ41485.1 hypothetical protein kam1_230 [Methylacidiphilum kamchatkense Kam1]